MNRPGQPWRRRGFENNVHDSFQEPRAIDSGRPKIHFPSCVYLFQQDGETFIDKATEVFTVDVRGRSGTDARELFEALRQALPHDAWTNLPADTGLELIILTGQSFIARRVAEVEL